jgi:hypothetical protein
MIPDLHHRFHDWAAGAGGPAIVAAVSVLDIENWLKLAVLILTIIFMAMGIYLRFRSIRTGKGGDE